MDIDVSKGFDLGCFHFDVKTDPTTNDELRIRGMYGECAVGQRQIRVASDVGSLQYHNTYLHELIEAVVEIYCNGKVEHDQITNLGNGLAQVFASMNLIFRYGENDGRKTD